MGKGRIFGVILLLLGLGCFAMYFVLGDQIKSEFKVVFDSNGGTAVAEQVVQNGEKVNKPTDPTKENSEFLEWQLDGVAYVFDNPVTKDMTLKASWKEYTMHTIKVTLEEKEYTASVIEGETFNVSALNMPEKEGFDIKLYNGSDEEVDLTQPINNDMVLIGKYVEIKTYTVKFDSQGGTSAEEAKVQENEKVSEPSVTKDGYTFDGWYLDSEKFDFGTPITKDITLKAKWVENGKINVTFMADDKVYKTSSVKENTKVSKPSNPTKKGYKFVEWQTESGEKFDFDTKITEEIKLIAKFEESNTKTVSFNSDGGSKVSSQEVEEGAKAKKPSNPTKSGYVFKEWQLNGETYDFDKEVTDDIALKAVWEKEEKKYTVKFDTSGGSEIANQTVTEGAKATKPADPTKEGYKFVEWLYNNATYDFDTEVTKDITLVARYEKDSTAANTPDTTENTGDVNPVDEDK